MKGRPPKPTHLKLLLGNPSRRPITRTEVEAKPRRRVPPPPEWLNPYAAAEWKRLASGLREVGLLSALDEGALAAYAVRAGHLKIAELAMAIQGKHDAGAEGMLIKNAYNQDTVNPLMRVSSEAAAAVLKFAEHFGMTPAARARIDAAKLVDKQGPDADQDEEPEEDRATARIR